MTDSEKNIASFYQENLHLIAPELEGKTSLAEQVLGKDRLDLLVRLTSGVHSIIEFKKKPLLPADVAQLTRYWRKWGKTHKMAFRHYLVGLRPADLDAVHAKVLKAPMKVVLRFIPEDVPTVVCWSKKGRKYIAYEEGMKESPIELFVSRK